MKKKFISGFLTFFSLFSLFSPPLLAKNISLYEQPKADSKLIGTLDSQAGIMTIFTPKEGDWVKVADPRNGNVGWAKLAELKESKLNWSIAQSSDGTHTYQFIQYGQAAPLKPQEVSDTIKKMELREKAMQQDMAKLMNQMFADWHDHWFSSPMILPIVMVPVEKAPPIKDKHVAPVSLRKEAPPKIS